MRLQLDVLDIKMLGDAILIVFCLQFYFVFCDCFLKSRTQAYF